MAPRTQRANSRGFLRVRPRIILGLLLLAALAWGAHAMWQKHQPSISQHPQYAITAADIHLPPAPPWIRTDIRNEVLRDAGLVGNLSLLNQNDLLPRLREAFGFHPWVASVGQISKRLPAGIEVELEYRRPVAAVETAGRQGVELLVVDRDAIRLPERDLTDAERRYLPRIAVHAGPPLVGQHWNDLRVTAGVRLADRLGSVWQSLQFMAIEPHRIRQSLPGTMPSFDIRTRGGTRIVWGAAPGDEGQQESPFADKLQRVQDYATEHGDLGSIEGPQLLDVRRQLLVEPRTAKNSDDTVAQSEPDAAATDDGSDEPKKEVAAREDADATTDKR